VKQSETQIGLSFRVKHADGRTEQFVVDAERALIGSAAHCEVRLPKESAAPEHIEVFASEGRVHLSTRAAESPPMLDGAAYSAGPWAAGRVLSLGATTLTVSTVELGERHRGRSPLWLLAPVPIIGLIATLVYAQTKGPGEPSIPDAPTLFDAPATTCPMPPGDQLEAFAAERLRLALSKRERGPFSPRDAVDAVPLFELAAACFHISGAQDDERESAGAAAALRKKLDDEYRVRRVRVEHAYRIEDPLGAKRELVVLLPMTAHRPGSYVDWLASLDRYATLALEQRGSHRIGQ
jgi:hypothetical protein